MRLIIDFLLWLAFSVVFYFTGKELFPKYNNSDILVASIAIAWVVALLIVLFWALKAGPSSLWEEKQSKLSERSDENKKGKGGPANHFVGFTADGGWLSYQPDSLVFKPHALNFAGKDWSIKYSEIADVQPGPFKNLIIISKSGQQDIFVVNKKQKWLEDIRKRMGSA